MKRSLLRLAFLSLLAMPISSYGNGPVQQTGKSFEEVEERINAWLEKGYNFKKGPWYKEALDYVNRNTTHHSIVIKDQSFRRAVGYPYMWLFLGGSTEGFANLKKMKIDDLVKKYGENSIFVDLKTRYAYYVKPYTKIPFVELSPEKLEEIFGEAIIRRLGDQIDKFVEEHPEEGRRSSGEE